MKVVAIALVLLIGAALAGERAEALGRVQTTDWYSRGIIRQQTINGMVGRHKSKHYRTRKKRKAHATPRRTTAKSKTVAKS